MNWKKYKPVNVQAVDMCAATIFTHREKMIPIKAIYLLPRMYGQFKQWAEKQHGKEIQDEILEFDTVQILQGKPNQSTPLLIQLWEQNPLVGKGSFKYTIGEA
jgi:hypothetical protein